MTAELVGRDDGGRGSLRPARRRAARGDRGTGRHREDGGRDRGRPQLLRRSVGTDGVWLARLETAVTADDVVDVLISAMDGPGGEAALFERLKSSSAFVILDNCEHVIDAAAALAVRLLDAAPGLRILCTSQVPLDIDGEVVFELAPLALVRRRRAVHPPRHCTTPEPHRDARTMTACSTCAALSTVCRWRSSSPRREPRRCPSRRSPGASTIGSSC